MKEGRRGEKGRGGDRRGEEEREGERRGEERRGGQRRRGGERRERRGEEERGGERRGEEGRGEEGRRGEEGEEKGSVGEETRRRGERRKGEVEEVEKRCERKGGKVKKRRRWNKGGREAIVCKRLQILYHAGTLGTFADNTSIFSVDAIMATPAIERTLVQGLRSPDQTLPALMAGWL